MLLSSGELLGDGDELLSEKAGGWEKVASSGSDTWLFLDCGP